MVRLSLILARVPVIKFRKGGISQPSGSSPASASGHGPATGAAPAAGSVPHMQTKATMSTAAISDLELPLRYRRRPLSQEEIDHINGGGIV